jgi:hypothetical protein
MRPPHVHYLSGNAAERSPHHFVAFDTETRWTSSPAGEVHTLRLWCARDVLRSDRHPRQQRHRDGDGLTAGGLADWLEASCRSSETTWIFAHNLGFDLAVTRLPLLLMERGWAITQSALTIDHPWLRLRKRSKRITMVDSHSWLPQPLQRIGAAIAVTKPALPDNDDSDDAWRIRCAGDVDILATAMEQLMDWWDAGRFGCWSLTGPATGWNALRHIPGPERVTIDPDPEIRRFERAAILSGRREAFRVGQLPPGHYVELDFERAYLSVCRRLPLPRQRSVAFDHLELGDFHLRSERWSVIADCVVRASAPRYPLQLGRRVWHPVGTFRTRLCGPEIWRAMARGELLEVGPGHVYRLGHQMSQWAWWIETLLDGSPDDVPPAAKMAAKGWSRTVPGKWGTRTSREVDAIPSHLDGWWLEPGIHHPSGARCQLLHLGGTQHLVLQDQEADDAFPAVLAWIQSYVRDRLGLLIDQVPVDSLVSCNTDGCIVRAGPWMDLARIGEITWPLVPRVKGTYRTVEVLSPQHLVLDGRPRLSGVPGTAGDAGPSSWSWATWPGLARQLELRTAGGYTRETRTVDLSRVPVARWVLEGGATLPVAASWAPETGSVLLPPSNEHGEPLSGFLRARQHPVLARLL